MLNHRSDCCVCPPQLPLTVFQAPVHHVTPSLTSGTRREHNKAEAHAVIRKRKSNNIEDLC